MKLRLRESRQESKPQLVIRRGWKEALGPRMVGRGGKTVTAKLFMLCHGQWVFPSLPLFTAQGPPRVIQPRWLLFVSERLVPGMRATHVEGAEGPYRDDASRPIMVPDGMRNGENGSRDTSPTTRCTTFGRGCKHVSSSRRCCQGAPIPNRRLDGGSRQLSLSAETGVYFP